MILESIDKRLKEKKIKKLEEELEKKLEELYIKAENAEELYYSKELADESFNILQELKNHGVDLSGYSDRITQEMIMIKGELYEFVK